MTQNFQQALDLRDKYRFDDALSGIQAGHGNELATDLTSDMDPQLIRHLNLLAFVQQPALESYLVDDLQKASETVHGHVADDRPAAAGKKLSEAHGLVVF